MRSWRLALLALFILVSCAEPPRQSDISITIAFVTERAMVVLAVEEATPTLVPAATDTTAPKPTLDSLPTDTATAEPPAVTVSSLPAVAVSVNAANVRSGPGTNFPIAAVAQNGEMLPVIATSDDGDWYNVTLPDGRTGWIGGSVVTVVSTAALEEEGAAQEPALTPTIQEPTPTMEAVAQVTEVVATDTAVPLPTNTAEPLPTVTELPPPPTATELPPGNEQIAVVASVTDGDTIRVILNGQDVPVRYIGIDTPEYDQPCGNEATQANAGLVAGQMVRLVKDVSETDRYGRLLRYVYVGDLFVNAELVRQGWARAVQYPPDTAQAGYLEAQQAGAPVHDCAQPTLPPPPPPEPTQPSVQGNCDPSYPTVCIPSPPPDLDCGDIPYRRFQVVGSDPHRFDGDHDGVGCESG